MAPRVTPAARAICSRDVRLTPCSKNIFSAASRMDSRVASASALVFLAMIILGRYENRPAICTPFSLERGIVASLSLHTYNHVCIFICLAFPHIYGSCSMLSENRLGTAFAGALISVTALLLSACSNDDAQNAQEE